jgi:hypothetical protein
LLHFTTVRAGLLLPTVLDAGPYGAARRAGGATLRLAASIAYLPGPVGHGRWWRVSDRAVAAATDADVRRAPLFMAVYDAAAAPP